MPTLERDEELDHIAAALEAATEGHGTTIVVEGPAGIGKSQLLADARALAKVRGFGRMSSVADELESAMPWAVVRQLPERLVSRYGGETRAKILAGPTGPALDALASAPPEARPGDAALARTLHSLWWVAADLSSYRPVLITVDDAQWADTPSLHFLAYLAQRIADLPILLLVATRPPTSRSGPLAELVAARHGRRLAPGPLSPGAIAELATRNGVAPAPQVVDALRAATRGNPFLTRQLLDALDERDLALHDPRTAGAIGAIGPAGVSRALLSRLPEHAVQLATAAALLGRSSDRRLAAELAGMAPERVAEAVDVLVAGHVLDGSREDLTFVHPVVREAVLAELRSGERSALHAEAALRLHEAGAPASRVAAHLAGAPAGTLPEAAALLRQVAAQLLANGDATTAVRYLRRALDERPHDASLLAELGTAELRAEEPAAAREHLLAAAAAAEGPEARAERLAAAASATLAIQGSAAAVDELRGVLDAWPEPARSPSRLALEAQLATMSVFMAEDLERSGERLRQFEDLPGDTPAERTLLALLAQRAFYDVRPAADVRELVARALAGGAFAKDLENVLPWGNAMNALIAADGVETAAAELEHARRVARAAGSPVWFAAVSAISATLSWRRGHVADTEAEAEAVIAALAPADPTPPVVGVRAVAARYLVLAALERGSADAAAAAIAAFDATSPDSPGLVPVERLRDARAALALRHDQPAVARDEALRLGEQMRAARIDTPSVPWRVRAAVAFQRLGEEDRARELAAEQLDLARAWGASSDLGAALRLTARLDPDRRLDLLDEALAVLEDAPDRLELAHVLVDSGAALRVSNRRSEARDRLNRAVDVADACGAVRLRTQALDGLSALGDRPRRHMFSGTEGLTASERRVAELASLGRTNRDIAQDLFVTPKTVENHLGRVYMKLGVKGRHELVAALG